MMVPDGTARKAREAMAGFCRVCPVCDGRACAGEVPGMGGAGRGLSFAANLEALGRWRLNMRTLHNASDPDTSITLFGEKLAFPILPAPIGGASFNMSSTVAEGEYIRRVLQGAADGGTIGCSGDGEEEKIHRESCRAISETGKGIPFIKPWKLEEVWAKGTLARDAGAKVMGIDVDAAGLITLRKMGKPVYPRGKQEMEELIKGAPLPVIVKGIMCPDEASLAVEAGAAAIVVSNHGGRVLEGCPGTAEVVQEIVQAVRGRIPVLADGGVRSGMDAFRMLALGADAVLVGRPVAIAAMGGGSSAVKELLENLGRELYRTMIMTGCADLDSITMDCIRA